MAEESERGRRSVWTTPWIWGGALAAVGVGLLMVWAVSGMGKPAIPVEAATEGASAATTVAPEAAADTADTPYESPPDEAPVVTTRPAHMAKAQLLVLAEKREAAVWDLAVEYDMLPVEGAVSQTEGFHIKVARKGEKVYFDESHGQGQDTSRFRTISAFNGSQWVQFQCYDSMATIMETSEQPPGMIQQEMWSAFAMLGGRTRPGVRLTDASLVSLLQSPGCLVHLNMQEVAGRQCVVVDDVGWSGVRRRVWVDLARGLLPQRMSFWSGGQEVVEYRTIEAAEVGGVWCPTWGEQRSQGTITRLEVRDRGTPHMGLHVNGGLADDVFDLEKKLPADATIVRPGAPAPVQKRGARRRGHRSEFDPGLPGE